MTGPLLAHDPAAVQRRTVGVLMAAQALGGLGNTVGIAVAAILAEEVSGSESLAGLVQTLQVVGAAVASYLLARLMGARGRRPGLVLGYTLGACGSALCVVAGVMSSFPVLLVGALLLGSTTAAGLQSRYAAADLAAPAHRARSLSLVLWATTVGAVLGPNLSGPAGGVAERIGLPRLTGAFAMSVVCVLVAAVVLAVLLRPDPLLLARAVGGQGAGAPAVGGWRRTLELARHHPGIAPGVLGLSAAHAVMVAVMVMTPLHMHHGGAELEVIGFVISAHVLGMFAFSPFAGYAADRWGRPPVLLTGATVLLLATWLSGTAPAGASVRIGVGLFLLGLGWSLSTVAASTLLTETTPVADRTSVQGTADLVMNGSAAVAGLVAGVVVDLLGFGSLNLFAALLVLGVVRAAVAARRPVAAAP